MMEERVESPSYKHCPISKDKKPNLECKTCKYRDACLDDILRDGSEETLKIWGRKINLIRKIVEGTEIK